MPPPGKQKIKLNINVRPDNDPSFYDLNLSRQKYVWANWNNMRAKVNKAAVQFPVVGEVTHKPWGGVTASPNVTVEPHLRHPSARNNQPLITQYTVDQTEQEINAIQELFKDPNVMKQFDINQPSTSGVKKTGTALDEMAPPHKKAKLDNAGNTSEVNDSSVESVTMEGGNEAQAAAASNIAQSSPAISGVSSQAAEKYEYVARPLTFRNKQTLMFNKVHKMLSYGIEFKILNSGNETFMCTSLLEVPWDRVFFYLSKSEFQALPQGCRATKAEIKIIQRNTRVAFEAGAGVSGLATLNQNKFGIKALNLPAKIVGSNYSYSFAAANPMTPMGATEKSYGGYVDKLYGLTPLSANFSDDMESTSQPWHTLGIPFHFNSYFTMRSDNNTYASTSANTTKLYPGWGHYSSHVTEYDMNAFIGDCIHMQTYHFKCAPLKKPVVGVWPLLSNGQLTINTHSNYNLPFLSNINPNLPQHPVPAQGEDPDLTGPSVQPACSINFSPYDNDADITFDETSLIERAATYTKNVHMIDPVRQPSIHIGVKPIPKLSTISEVPTGFTDCEAWFEVSATLHVEYDMNTDYPAFTGANTNNDQLLKGLNVRPEDAMQNLQSRALNANRPLMYGVYNNA